MHNNLIAKVRKSIASGKAKTVTLAPSEVLANYVERECHANVASWVADHPGDRAVHGWLITGNCVYVLHSVVESGDHWLDITPRPGMDSQSLNLFVPEEMPISGLPVQLIDVNGDLEVENVAPRLSVYLDNNVWDFLFERNIDLTAALPQDQFCLAITREAEFEIPAIPDSKAELKEFIAATITRCSIPTDSLFGFNDNTLPASQQRYGGFDFGRFASQEELEYLTQQRMPLSQVLRKTGLYKDEADRALAMRSIHSVVLTLDAKKGPINTAYQQGGKVVFLSGFDKSGLSLAQYIVKAAGAHGTLPLAD